MFQANGGLSVLGTKLSIKEPEERELKKGDSKETWSFDVYKICGN